MKEFVAGSALAFITLGVVRLISAVLRKILDCPSKVLKLQKQIKELRERDIYQR